MSKINQPLGFLLRLSDESGLGKIHISIYGSLIHDQFPADLSLAPPPLSAPISFFRPWFM